MSPPADAPSTALLLAALGALALGVLLGWLLTAVRRNRAHAEVERDAAVTRAGLEAALAGERARREEAETARQRAEGARDQLDRELAVARERVERAQQLLDEQKAFVERSKKELEDAFRALSAEALRGSSEQFLTLAAERLAAARGEATADLDARKLAVETLIAPLRETLGQLAAKTGELEQARVASYSRLDQRVQELASLTSSLQERTTILATALRGSQVRGRWGEVALRNIVELAGMTEHCDFEEQTGLEDRKRPDLVVTLPGGRKLAIDSKVPLAGYLEAIEAKDEVTREAASKRHARDLDGHVRALAARDYATALRGDLDLVILFLPGDPMLAAAFAIDPDLQVRALREKVLIATPTTLMALLRTVAIYWQQSALAENAEAIAETARRLYERAAVFAEHLGKVGKGLDGALRAYNAAVGSFEHSVRPMAAQLETMKVTEQAKRRIEYPEALETAPKRLAE